MFDRCDAFLAVDSVCKNFFTTVLCGESLDLALVFTKVRKNIEPGRNLSFSVIFFKFTFQLTILLEIFLQEIPKDLALIGSTLHFIEVKLRSFLQLLVFNLQIVKTKFNFVCATSILVHSLSIKRFKFGY